MNAYNVTMTMTVRIFADNEEQAKELSMDSVWIDGATQSVGNFDVQEYFTSNIISDQSIFPRGWYEV